VRVLWVPESTLPTAIALAADGGRNGVHVKASDDPWGATAGENGGSLTGLVLPEGTVRALPLIEALGSSTLCQGDSVILRIVDADTVQWSTGATTTAITVSEPGVYWARAVTGGGCTGTDTIVVQRNPAVLAYAGSDVRVCQGGSIVLDGGGVSGTPPYSYAWTPSVGLDASDVPHPVAAPDVPTRYLLTVTDARGCRDTASVFVEPVSADLQIAWTGSAGEWRFDSVDLATPRCDSLRIANTGTDTIVIGSAALRHNTTFSIPPSQLPLRVPPGQDRPLFVCCDPESIGEYNDTLLLRANCDLLVRLAASGNYPAIFGFDECGSRIGLRAPDSDNVLVKISSPYPNPASEVVTVPLERSSRPGASAPAERFVMRDLLGTVVAEGEYHRSSVRNLAGRIDERGSCTFDVAGMPQGYYFITVSTATETFLFPVVVDRR